MVTNYCVDCADCIPPKNPNDPLQGGKYRCGHSEAVGAHHEVLGEAPRHFGVDLVNAPLCSDMRAESHVFETCGPEGRWFRTADEKIEQEAERDKARAAAQAEKDEVDRKAAASAASAAA
jgi:hypothetical protein